MSRPASSATNTCSPARGGGALQEVAAERLRQIEGEGWTPEHDDIHVDGELADAAACYAAGRIPQAVYSKAEAIREASGRYGSLWPWDGDAWKPRGRRDNLIRAGALILAEIERLDRINPK